MKMVLTLKTVFLKASFLFFQFLKVFFEQKECMKKMINVFSKLYNSQSVEIETKQGRYEMLQLSEEVTKVTKTSC